MGDDREQRGEDADPDREPGGSETFLKALEDFEREKPSPGPGRAEPVVGARIRGTLVAIGDEQSLVDFGGRSEALVETKHLRDEAGALKHQPGDLVELFVVEAADQIVLAPSLLADPRAAWSQVHEARRTEVPVTGRATSLNAGGLEVDLGGVRGFCPVSQVEAAFCADPSVYVGRTLQFLVTELDEARGTAVLSRKALLRREEQEKASRLLASLKPGDEIEGSVTRLEPFGAFVNIGGVDGLVHVSEISHDRTAHPRDALAEGQKVRVRVLRIDRLKDDRPRIGLSIKAAAPDPWANVGERFTKGLRVRGAVVRLTDFGAFVNLAPGIDGLVHVSEAAPHRVSHVKEVLSQGQDVEALVLAVDPVKRRISLSIREAIGESAPAARSAAVGDAVEGVVAGIKPYGVFVDLPVYGHRVRGLVPREETGEPRNADLMKRFKVGQPLAVEVIEVKEGKIRLSAARAAARAEERGFRSYEQRGGPAPDAPPTAMAEALRKAMEAARKKQEGR